MTKASSVLLIATLMLLAVCAVLLDQRQQNHTIIAEQKLHLTKLQGSLPSASSLLQTTGATSVQVAPGDGAVSGVPMSDGFQKNPSYRSGIRLQAEVNARRRSGDFKAWAGISTVAFEELIELLGKQEIETQEQWSTASASLTESEAELRNSALRKRHESQMRELLGPAGYQTWKEWQDNSASRQWVRHMNERLRPADSVNQEKARGIVAALRQVELEIRGEPRNPAESSVEHAARVHQRIHSVAASVLSPIQLKQFEILQKEWLEAMGALAALAEEERSRKGE